MAEVERDEVKFLESVKARKKADRSAVVKIDDLIQPYLKVGDSTETARSVCTRLGMTVQEGLVTKQIKLPFLWCTRWVSDKGILFSGRSELVVHISHAEGHVVAYSATIIFRSL